MRFIPGKQQPRYRPPPPAANQNNRAISRDHLKEELLRELLNIFPDDEVRVRSIIEKNPKITDLNMLTGLLLEYREKY